MSDNLLYEYFGDDAPAYKQRFRAGADLRLFRTMPFALNLPSVNSSQILARHLETLGITLRCVHTSSHPDLHHMMSVRDYAASFCLTMYLPALQRLNAENRDVLNIFPVEGLEQTNSVVVGHLQSRVLPQHGKALLRMIREQCGAYAKYDL